MNIFALAGLKDLSDRMEFGLQGRTRRRIVHPRSKFVDKKQLIFVIDNVMLLPGNLKREKVLILWGIRRS